MTSPDTEELRRLAEAATDGPWRWAGYINGSIELRAGQWGTRVLTTTQARPCINGRYDEGKEDWWVTDDACESCRAEARKTQDPFIDYRGCERATEGTHTIWLHDPDRHVIRPANEWAVREQSYRDDVARVDHPDAAYIAAANPAAVTALLDDLDSLRTRRAALEAEVERVRAALTELVALKDGPRDDEYDARKPRAWLAARAALTEGTDQP